MAGFKVPFHLTLASALLLSACSTESDLQPHTSKTSSPIDEEAVTVAKAQREVRIGMTSSAVTEALGSPNMVTTDEKRRETWVYDKISTQVKASCSSAGVWFLIFGGSDTAVSSTQTQRTLTIIVKFDEQGAVRDFAYRASAF
ncbi:MAG: outer membrane protein assembly factor BamE [Alphaproteobacteria bacterium]|nr:outer membrane protein assembly factor BamE [Alphaproteobacteria bacterium]